MAPPLLSTRRHRPQRRRRQPLSRWPRGPRPRGRRSRATCRQPNSTSGPAALPVRERAPIHVPRTRRTRRRTESRGEHQPPDTATVVERDLVQTDVTGTRETELLVGSAVRTGPEPKPRSAERTLRGALEPKTALSMSPQFGFLSACGGVPSVPDDTPTKTVGASGERFA